MNTAEAQNLQLFCPGRGFARWLGVLQHQYLLGHTCTQPDGSSLPELVPGSVALAPVRGKLRGVRISAIAAPLHQRLPVSYLWA